jgi:hypothetical protein
VLSFHHTGWKHGNFLRAEFQLIVPVTNPHELQMVIATASGPFGYIAEEHNLIETNLCYAEWHANKCVIIRNHRFDNKDRDVLGLPPLNIEVKLVL